MNLSSELKKLANMVVYSKSTQSEYYNIGCIKIRVSDHMAVNIDSDLAIFATKDEKGKRYMYAVIPMVGTYKEVQWFTNIKGVIEFIVRFESIARILIKSPSGKSAAKSDIEETRELSNNIQEVNQTESNVEYAEWKMKLATMYVKKNAEFKEILDELYATAGTKITLGKLIRIGGLKHDEKKIQLQNLLKTIKK